jgi:hypothetical protein
LHGGLNGTENTGYDDSAMDAYLEQGLVQISDEENYGQLLFDHRNHLLVEKIKSQNWDYLTLGFNI